jgi:tRNA C32,U32 (ribose-2'-O)-methylase TrmJ
VDRIRDGNEDRHIFPAYRPPRETPSMARPGGRLPCSRMSRQLSTRPASPGLAAVSVGFAASDLDFAGPVALVFGNESRGVSDDALALSDARYAIPMRGFSQSLNVSVAAAVSLAGAIDRREAQRGSHGDLPEAEARELRDRFYLLAVKQRSRIARAEAAADRRTRRRR